jgi:hypothetical protein
MMKISWLHAFAAAAIAGLALGPAPAAAAAFNFAFYDANNVVAILRGKPGTTPADAWTILKAYNVTPDNLQTKDFLKDVDALKAGAQTLAARTSSGNALVIANAAIPGGLSDTAAIDAIGTFIAQRFKQEAEIAGVQEIVTALKKLDDSPKFNHPMTALLPRTVAFANATSSGGMTSTPASWNTLTTDFRADFGDLATTINPFLDTLYPANQPLTEQRYFVQIFATAAAGVISSARTPNLILASVAKESADLLKANPAAGNSPRFMDFDAALAGLVFASEMLTERGTTSPWANADELNAYFSAPAAAGVTQADAGKILLGMAAAKDPDLYKVIKAWLTRQTTTPEALLSDPAKLRSFLDALGPLFAALAKDSSALPSIQSATPADARFLILDLTRVAATSVSAIAAFKDSVARPDAGNLRAAAAALSVVVEVTQYAKTGNYSGIVSDLIVLVPVLLPAESGSPAEGIENFLIGPGQAIAALAQAKNQADFTAALDSYALPVGSYTQKQRSYESATLNGYFGVTAGAEMLAGATSGSGVSRISPHAGFTAPIGVGWNWGMANDAVKHTFLGLFDIGSESIFIPMIDVGAVASWRLGNGSGKLAAVTWSNVVAPGAYFVWTAKDTPFSFMVGTQYGPQLRTVTASGGATIQHAAWQVIAISFTFDIPIFNLYQKRAAPTN